MMRHKNDAKKKRKQLKRKEKQKRGVKIINMDLENKEKKNIILKTRK